MVYGFPFISVGDRLSVLNPQHVSYNIDSAGNFTLRPGSNLDADWGQTATPKHTEPLLCPCSIVKIHPILPGRFESPLLPNRHRVAARQTRGAVLRLSRIIDVYINGRDRKPPVLDWAARGVAKYRSIRLLCVRTKSRQGHQGQQLGRGRRDEPPVATIAFAGACSCEHWLSRRRISRRATSYRAIAMIPAMVAHNTDLSAWLSAFALHPTSTAPRSDGIPDDIQLAGCVETSAAQGLMHSSLMTCGNKGTNQSDYLGAGSCAAASRHCSISIRRRPMRRSAPPRSSSCAS